MHKPRIEQVREKLSSQFYASLGNMTASTRLYLNRAERIVYVENLQPQVAEMYIKSKRHSLIHPHFKGCKIYLEKK